MAQNGPTVDLELICMAQRGRRESQTLLAKLTERKVFTYIYRTTLDHHLSQDLCQETLLEMVRSLPKTQMTNEKAFWAWLYRVALTKIQHHFRVQGHTRIDNKTCVDTDLVSGYQAQSDKTGLDKLVKEEMINAISRAMNALSRKDRSVLTLRCFDDLSYRQIASVMGVTKLSAKVAFFRAKQSLKRQLARNGFTPSFLASALGIFALMTDKMVKTAQAAALVKTSSLKVGTTALVVGSIIYKPIVTTILAVSLFAVPVVHYQMCGDSFSRNTQSLNNLIEAGIVVPPVTLIGANYSHDGGLLQKDLTKSSRSRMVKGDAIVPILNPKNIQCVVLRYQNWIEVGFERDLVDGPGPDIFVGSVGCKHFYLFVTDGAASEYRLAHHLCDPNEHGQYELMEFDLAGHNIPFTPKAVRLVVAGVSIPGNNIHTLCARIGKSLPSVNQEE
ncbi:MAG: RNA polymerase sigma factor [Phycisphaerales bacterium]|jgi:RNA polymerase sigma-70 factor (ECF subfamily)